MNKNISDIPARSGTPEAESAVSRFMCSLKWPLIILSVAVSVRYLYWRGAFTLDHQSPLRLAVSLALYLAELFGFSSVLLFFVQSAKLTSHSPVELPDDKLPAVDILVTIYTEPAEVLYRTLAACNAMDYPKGRFRVYVCDDGNRPEIKELAEKFGCGYVTRTERTHAKAGNVNNALKHVSSELFMILDCDHIPVRSFLKETVGFFSVDPKLAFVQTPHHFYNPDCHQKNLMLHGELVHEQDLFFQVLEPGRDNTNSAIFAGSAAIFRRSAIDDIGGFRCEVAIEDLHTGMELHSRGYRSLFYNRILTGGLSPETYIGYLTQRNRWAKGGVQLFVIDNPLIKPGLSLMQRINYLASLQYFFGALPRMVFLMAPLAFLVFSFTPLVTDIRTFIWYFLPHYVLAHLAFQLVSGEFRSPFWSDVYDTGTAFLLSLTIIATLPRPEKLVFKVTPKGSGTSPQEGIFHWRYVVPHMILMLLTIAGLVKGVYAVGSGSLNFGAYALGSVWALFNLLLLGVSVEVARERPQKRSSFRLDRHIPCLAGFDGITAEGETVDISEGGAMVQLRSHHHVPEKVTLKFRGQIPDDTAYECAVIRTMWVKGLGDKLVLRFTNAGEQTRRGLLLQMFSAPDAWQNVRRPLTDSVSAISHMALAAVRRKKSKANPESKMARYKANIPCQVYAASGVLDCVMENLSLTGAALRVPPGHELAGSIVIKFKSLSGKQLSVRAAVIGRAAGGSLFSYGVKFVEPPEVEPTLLLRAAN